VMMDPDTTTGTGARAPGVEREELARMAVRHRVDAPTQSGKASMATERTKGGGKPCGAHQELVPQGKAPPDRPALEPYWGKPAVRNLRGDDGNVGIIRSPVRAIVLPDD
jgi:hypothetical protein